MPGVTTTAPQHSPTTFPDSSIPNTSAREAFQNWAEDNNLTSAKEADVNDFLTQQPHHGDRTNISWNRSLKNQLASDQGIEMDRSRVFQSLYRPFTKQQVYFDRPVNDMVYQLPQIFPTPNYNNIGILVTSPKPNARFSVSATNLLAKLGFFWTNRSVFPGSLRKQ